MSSLINALFGGGGGGGSNPFTPYSPTGLSGADTNWQNLFNQYMGGMTGPGSPGATVMGTATPGYEQALQVMGQYGPNAMSVAENNVAPYLWGMASQADAMHNLMSGMGNQDQQMMNALQQAGGQVFNTAMDPQKALYDSLAQKTQDQSRAASSARGIGVSPEAAGLENEAMTNFNIDWENQQLQRQLSGLQGLGTADTTAGKLGEGASQQYTGAQAMSALAPQLMTQSANAPLSQYGNLWNMGTGIDQGYLSLAQQANAPQLQLLNQIIPYLNYGAGAQSNAFGAGQANLSNLYGLGGLLTNNYGQGAGGGMGILGSLFSNPFGGVDPSILSAIAAGGSGVGSDAGMSALLGGLAGA